MAARIIIMLRWAAICAVVISIALIVMRWRYRRLGGEYRGSFDYWREIWQGWIRRKRRIAEHAKRLAAVEGKSALIVAPDDKSRRVMSWKLESLGCGASTAVTGKQGLDRARAAKPDLIFVDAILPDVTPDEFYTSLARPDVPVIFLGVLDDQWDELLALGSNVDCIAKPFDPEEAAALAGRLVLLIEHETLSQ